jgi:hypothetical protein
MVQFGVGSRVASPLPVGPGTAIVEDRLADHLDVDLALDALDHPQQDVLGLVVGRGTAVGLEVVLRPPVADREEVADHDPAGPRHPGGLEDVGARLVAAAHRGPEAWGADSPEAGAAVQ